MLRTFELIREVDSVATYRDGIRRRQTAEILSKCAPQFVVTGHRYNTPRIIQCIIFDSGNCI